MGVAANNMTTIDNESAQLMAADLEDPSSLDLEGVQIIRGKHPGLGSVTFVIPSAGDAALLRSNS